MARGGQEGRERGIDAFSSEGRRNSQEDNKMALDDLKESLQWERTLPPEQEQSPALGHLCPCGCWDGDEDHRWQQEGGRGLCPSLPLTPCLTTGNIALSPPVSHL